MRSEPVRNPARGDRLDDELDNVPQEWSTLTRELSREADQLAAAYPPKPDALNQIAARLARIESPRRGVPWWGVSAATLLLSAGIAVSLFLHESAAPESAVSSQLKRSPGGSTAVVAQPEVPDEFDPFVEPVMFVSELSDPEFEAWLDLQRGQREERVAF